MPRSNSAMSKQAKPKFKTVKANRRKSVAENLRDHVWDICSQMEENKLTGLFLNFTNGWKVSLVNPKKQQILNRGGEPYPEGEKKQA